MRKVGEQKQDGNKAWENKNRRIMKEKKKGSRFRSYLAKEAGIEFKACLYFFCFLFFYSMFRIMQGKWDASIIHMAEMILATYGMGYLQMYAFSNFDEGEEFTGRTLLYSVVCSGIYTAVAYFGKWFDHSFGALGVFFGYVVFAYVCAFWTYKIKRLEETRALNEDLKAFQERSREYGECD